MQPLRTPDGYGVRFDADALEIGPKTLRQTGQIRVHGAHLRLWGVMWLHAEMHCAGDKTVLTLDQAAAEIGADGKMTLRPTTRWAEFQDARATSDPAEIGRQVLAFLEAAIGPEARRKRRAMRLTARALTALHPAAAQGRLTITANGRLLFQPLSNGWQGIHAPRAFTKVRLPDMLAWIGPTLQEGGPNQHGPRLQPALAYQQVRPEGSRHALLAAIEDAQGALAEAGLDPAGWFTEPRR